MFSFKRILLYLVIVGAAIAFIMLMILTVKNIRDDKKMNKEKRKIDKNILQLLSSKRNQRK